METERSLPHSHVPATCPYPEQNKGIVSITVCGHSIKTYGELEARLLLFLLSELTGGEWVSLTPRPLYLWGKGPVYLLNWKGWVVLLSNGY